MWNIIRSARGPRFFPFCIPLEPLTPHPPTPATTKPPLHAALMPIKGLNQATLPRATSLSGRLKFNVAGAVRMWPRISSVFSFDLLIDKCLAHPILWTADNGTVSPIVPQAQSYFLCSPQSAPPKEGTWGVSSGGQRGAQKIQLC